MVNLFIFNLFMLNLVEFEVVEIPSHHPSSHPYRVQELLVALSQALAAAQASELEQLREAQDMAQLPCPGTWHRMPSAMLKASER